MAVSTVEIEGIGIIKVFKRRGTRHLKISLSYNGEVKVSIPTWTPTKAAIEFAKSKSDWINQHRKTVRTLASGQKIGKAHVLLFSSTTSQRITTSTKNNELRVFLPPVIDSDSIQAQTLAQKAAVKLLIKEARQLLPQRVEQLAHKTGLGYAGVDIKKLKTRWGSCNSRKELTLNCFLMQLPWRLIDYVILHELTHTQIMAHGTKFWQQMAQYCPEADSLRKEMKSYHPYF